MKYKKYILFFLLLIFLGCNKTYAANYTDTCYYMGDELKASFAFGKNNNDVYIDTIGKKIDHDSEDMLNWRPVIFRGVTTKAGHKFEYLYKNLNDARTNGACPNYIVVQYCKVYNVWGTNDLNEAITAAAEIDSVNGCVGRYGSFKDSTGNKITPNEYYASLINPQAGGREIDLTDPEKACNEIFGDINDAGKKDSDGNTIEPPSLAYMINSVLQYVRIIVPILVILLGSLDFAKAVVAGKEDEMKKAQLTFFKRIIAGVIIFFVPLIVNVVMWLADIVWDGLNLSHCNIP